MLIRAHFSMLENKIFITAKHFKIEYLVVLKEEQILGVYIS